MVVVTPTEASDGSESLSRSPPAATRFIAVSSEGC